MQTREINVLVLAYLGDGIYENYIRRFLIEKGIANVNDLQKESINYVSAKGQAAFLNKMLDNNFLSEEEITIVKRARNYKTTSHPKNCDIVTYKYATGLSAASVIVNNILSGKEGAVENYIEFLKCGSRKSPLESLKIAGVDLTDKGVIDGALHEFKNVIDMYRENM